MPRYFFDTLDGDRDTDQLGVNLADDEEAVEEAIRYAGALIKDDPAMVTAQNELTVTARSKTGQAVAQIRIGLSRAAG